MKYRDLKTLSARQLIRERKERGFTLIDLVIVLAVLGVLAAIGIPQLTGLQDQAELQGGRDQRRVGNRQLVCAGFGRGRIRRLRR